MNPPIGLGIVGCGWAASEIVRAGEQIPSLKITVVFDTDRGRADALAAKAGAKVASDIDSLLADPAVTALYVGLPHRLLAPTVERALLVGKHVLSEKPLALDAAEAMRLGALAQSRHVKLAVFFELRRAGTIERARQIISAGDIGTVRVVRIQTLIDKRIDYWGPPGVPNWRAMRSEAGGGVVMMNTIHQLDTLRYITGLEFARASGELATFVAPADVEDAASASLRLSNGAILNLVATAHGHGASGEETIEIDGTLGRLDLPDPFGTAPLRLYHSARKSWIDIPVQRPDSHRLMLEAFLRSIVTDAPEPAGAADAAAALAAVEAIYRSATEGRTITIR
jgi:predicted dehydrogenase